MNLQDNTETEKDWAEMAHMRERIATLTAERDAQNSDAEAVLAETRNLADDIYRLLRQKAEVEAELDALRADLLAVAECLKDAECQWGDDYLWKKWNLSEALARPGVQAVLKD